MNLIAERKKTIILAFYAVFFWLMPVLVQAEITGGSDVRIEELILSAFREPDNSETILTQAQSLAEQMPGKQGVFYQIYISQCRFRIAATLLFADSDNKAGDIGTNNNGWVVLGLKESIKAMNHLEQDLRARNEESQRQISLREKALPDRCAFANAWSWYSLATVTPEPEKKELLVRAEKIFTGFLSRNFRQQNLPVIVNCLYGKGLCLRDSGRYYDLITMLDSVPPEMAQAVRFARLRLAAAVELSYSMDILRVVQNFFETGRQGTELSLEEREMLLECIEATASLLKRELPQEMKESLTGQLLKAVEFTENYGEPYQQRILQMVKGLDLPSSYLKLLVLRDQLRDNANRNYTQVFADAAAALAIERANLRINTERYKELLYLYAVSAWNIASYAEAFAGSEEYIGKYPGEEKCSQLAGIGAESGVRLVSDDVAGFDRYCVVLDKFCEQGLLAPEQCSWLRGLLLLNAGRYEDAYDYFGSPELDCGSFGRAGYGQTMTILPLLKQGRIDHDQAAELLIDLCQQFSSNPAWLTGEQLLNVSLVMCQAAELFLAEGHFALTDKTVIALKALPGVRQDISARITALELRCARQADTDISLLIDTVSSMNYQDQPQVFNAMIEIAGTFSESDRYADDLKIKVYKLLLSSESLASDNALAIRLALADCYYRQGDHSSFLAAYDSLAQRARAYMSTETYRKLAIANQSLGKYEAAARHWTMVQINSIAQTESLYEALYNKVLCLYYAGEVSRARQVLALAVIRDVSLGRDRQFINLNEFINRADPGVYIGADKNSKMPMAWYVLAGTRDVSGQNKEEGSR
ncbi:MAG: hypothetical protein JXM68_13225 [Sedimentisphaerales bacterium]|nr:hypothetical protein [Sedimentisphaerales bacterium]